jgi:hypothetical protein
MKLIFLSLSTVLVLAACSGQKPTKANIEKALRSTWDRPQTSSSPKQVVTLHSIKIGSSAKANAQDLNDGIPNKASVTIAQIDFTVREYYNDKTVATHRVMNSKVYKDQFGDWAVKSNGMKTIETTNEPAQ